MKERFYNFIRFLSEVHILEYGMYIFLILLTLELCEKYDFPISTIKVVVLVLVSSAFMNTWEISSRKYKNKKNDDKDIDNKK